MTRRWTSRKLVRHGVATVVMVLGSSVVLGSVVLLNQFSELLEKRDVKEGTSIQIQKAPKPKPKPEVKKPKPKPKQTPRSPPPPSLAALTSGLGGIAIDLPGFDMGDVSGQVGDLLGGNDEVTHTSDTVDVPPSPSAQVPPRYPSRERNKGIEGRVLLSVLVDKTGAVTDVRVIESSPPGVFDSAAMESVQRWRFTPGRYKGQPVSTRVEQPILFKLGR